jgi:hypothetical protein
MPTQFGDIGTFGNMSTEGILAKNREIAWVFFGDIGKSGDMEPLL